MPPVNPALREVEVEVSEREERLIVAILLAAEAHKDQGDKAGEPIFWHVLRVGFSLLPDMDAAIIGILHDVLEDCHLKYGTRALDVLGHPHLRETLCTLTRSNDEAYDDYIARVARDPLARKVKLADLEDNMNPMRLGRAVLNDVDVGPLMFRYLNALTYLRSCEGTTPR